MPKLKVSSDLKSAIVPNLAFDSKSEAEVVCVVDPKIEADMVCVVVAVGSSNDTGIDSSVDVAGEFLLNENEKAENRSSVLPVVSFLSERLRDTFSRAFVSVSDCVVVGKVLVGLNENPANRSFSALSFVPVVPETKASSLRVSVSVFSVFSSPLNENEKSWSATARLRSLRSVAESVEVEPKSKPTKSKSKLILRSNHTNRHQLSQQRTQ